MSNLVFPALAGLSLPVQRSAIWKTRVVETESGARYARALWSYPRWSYRLQFDVLRSGGGFDELQQLMGFFNAHQGDFDTWLFRDPDDRTATDQAFGVTDGTRTQWQLVRAYGGQVEPVKELDGVPAIKADGVALSSGVSVDLHTGVVTITPELAAGKALTWSGDFFWRCRFSKSAMEAEKFLQDIWKTGAVEFSTEK